MTSHFANIRVSIREQMAQHSGAGKGGRFPQVSDMLTMALLC